MTIRLAHMSDQEWQELLLEERQRARAAVREFTSAVAAGSVDRCAATFPTLTATASWRLAMKSVARSNGASRSFRTSFVQVWIDCGDALRNAVGDDLVLVDGLRALLPPYEGPCLQLFRGDSAWNRKRRTYGLAWTDSAKIADEFAQGLWRQSRGGSVVLTAQVQPEAIVCNPGLFDDRYEEREFIVDRRLLREISVLARYRPS